MSDQDNTTQNRAEDEGGGRELSARLSSKIAKHADLFGLILGIAGLIGSVITLEGLQRVSAVTLLAIVLLTVRAVLKSRLTQLRYSIPVAVTIGLAWAALSHFFSEDIELETLRPDRNSGFAVVDGKPYDFSQAPGSTSRSLMLNIGLRDVKGETHYLTGVSVEVESVEESSSVSQRLTSFQVSVVFTGDPTLQQLQKLEQDYGLKLKNQAKRVASFEAPNGISDSIVDVIRSMPHIRTVTITRFGTGQSPVNFVEVRLSPKLTKAGDTAAGTADIELSKDGTAGIRAAIEFARPGTYAIRGQVHGNSEIDLPLLRVTVSR